MTKINETLKIAKDVYKYSLNTGDDEYLQDSLLKIITNLTSIEEVIEKQMPTQKLISESSEIKKVKRRVPKWMKNTSQNNYKILATYMHLSSNGTIPIHISELLKYSELDSQKFFSNFNHMKTISEKNYAKVFSETDKMVILWNPVKEFIQETYKGNSNG